MVLLIGSLPVFSMELTTKVRKKDKAINECSVCLDPIPKSWPNKSTLCTFNKGEHALCIGCAQRISVSKDPACPLCRKPFTERMSWQVQAAHHIVINKLDPNQVKPLVDLGVHSIDSLEQARMKEEKKAELLRKKIKFLKQELRNYRDMKQLCTIYIGGIAVMALTAAGLPLLQNVMSAIS